MPIYEYECKACGHRFDKLQKISDEPLKDCPECGKPELQKLISAAGFRLSGGGWYETDFKKGNQRNLAKSDAKKDSGSTTGSSSQTKASSKAESGK